METDDSAIVVEMTVEELDFLDEFKQQYLRCVPEGSCAWSNVLESYVRAREHHSLPSSFCLIVPRLSGLPG